MDIGKFREDLLSLCEKHGVAMEDLNYELPRCDSYDMHAGAEISPDPQRIHHRSIIKSETKETIIIRAEFRATKITLSGGSRFEKQ